MILSCPKKREHSNERHRDHAIIEQVIADLKAGALAHLPSGKYAANAAWVALAVTAFNIARATAVAAGQHRARWATLRIRIINLPGIAATGRRLVLHLPTHWPWGGIKAQSRAERATDQGNGRWVLRVSCRSRGSCPVW